MNIKFMQVSVTLSCLTLAPRNKYVLAMQKSCSFPNTVKITMRKLNINNHNNHRFV